MKPLTVARDLQRRRARERTGLFLAEGVRCVEELLASPLHLRSVLLSPGIRATERGSALEARIRSSATSRGFDLSDVSDIELGAVTDTESPQGVIVIANRPERSFDSIDTKGIVLVLDGIQDPGNVGTILRTAEAFGVAATVALPGTVDLWNPKVVRSAMGALFTHNAFHADVDESLSFFRSAPMHVWATSTAGEPIGETSGATGVAIVVGNE
ncbi:MAG: TrmH family RNA methyltransferase, partial [Gemmatimonadales bacterium]